MPNLPTLRVLAAVLCIDPDDPNDADDLEAAALLLVNRVLREVHDTNRAEPRGRRLHLVPPPSGRPGHGRPEVPCGTSYPDGRLTAQATGLEGDRPVVAAAGSPVPVDAG